MASWAGFGPRAVVWSPCATVSVRLQCLIYTILPETMLPHVQLNILILPDVITNVRFLLSVP